MLTQETIDRIGKVLDKYPVQRALLFGSQARGDAREDSDIDLYLGYEDQALKRLGFGTLDKIEGELRKAKGKRVDIITEPRKPRLKANIERDHRVIYERVR